VLDSKDLMNKSMHTHRDRLSGASFVESRTNKAAAFRAKLRTKRFSNGPIPVNKAKKKVRRKKRPVPETPEMSNPTSTGDTTPSQRQSGKKARKPIH
jgi:hypothetical protein